MAIRSVRILLGTLFSFSLAAAALPRPVAAQQAEAASADATAPAITPEDEEKARGHFRLGRAYYDNGNFAQAAIEFEEAYRISQRSALLYNIYLAYRDANDTRNAASSLRKYLELQKDVENRGQLEARLAALERSLADGTAPQPAAVAQPTAVEAQPATDQPAETQAPTESAPADATQSEPSEEGTNLVPWVLMGTGGAMVLSSFVTGIMASGKESDLDSAYTACKKRGDCGNLGAKEFERIESLKSSGSTLALVTDILLFGGIAVAGTGAVLFILDLGKDGSSGDSAAAPTASLACLPGACAGSVRLAF